MSQCYLCAGEVGGDGAAVCGGCVGKALGPSVRATGEFYAPSVDLSPAPAPAPAPAPLGSCTWCSKPGAEVKKLLGNGAVSICNECVALCADVMQAELGDGWRS